METEIIRQMQHLSELIDDHEAWRGRQCINLISSENLMSPEARRILSSDLVHRYTSRDQFYGGSKFADQIEAFVSELACDVFRAKYADIRPLSGQVCNLATLALLAKEGSVLYSVDHQDGGYPGITTQGLGSILRLRNRYFPYDKEQMNIKVEEAKHVLEKERPGLVVFGSSFIPFPHPVAELKKTLGEAVAIYDGSHVLGLIAGGRFQDPFRDGCPILIGSTHKSFFGPQGGLILSQDEELFRVIERNIFPGIVDNIHLNRVGALGQALLEAKRFSEEYSGQVIRNSKTLAGQLSDLGLPVKCRSYGFTESHQVLLDFKSPAETAQVSSRLEKVNIIVDKGIRLGTSEVTRRGMKEPDVLKVGEVLAEALKENADLESLREKSLRIASEFSEAKFRLAA